MCAQPAADLRQFNRAEVLYQALFKHLYTTEAAVIQVTHTHVVDKMHYIPALHLTWSTHLKVSTNTRNSSNKTNLKQTKTKVELEDLKRNYLSPQHLTLNPTGESVW